MILAPKVGPLTAARVYLNTRLPMVGIPDVKAGATPPQGNPQRYIKLQLLGTNHRSMFTNDYLIRAVSFDADSERAEHTATRVEALLLGANHHRITTDDGTVWISGVRANTGPSNVFDPDVPLFGFDVSVFWTIALKPI